ncbi:hypothetical protein BH23ACI1_BH23ACI1_25430 [soil metagenome]|jgi:hypothetical protein|nr:hypothetical protein [Acidobacteriota bacterium]
MGSATFVKLYLIVVLAMASAGCEMIEGIFRAGVWVGVIMVVLVLGIVGWIATKLRA